jgi:hypothetical protein
MTLQDILDEVLLLSGMDTEASYATNGNDSVKRLVSIANNEAQKLARHHWQALFRDHSFTLTTATTYTLPDDFRTVVPGTMYTDSDICPVDFPTDIGEWAYLQASSGGSSTKTKVRIRQDAIEVYEPVSGEVIEFEYITKYPVQDSTGVSKQYFTADSDTFILDDDLLLLRVMAQYKRLMGLQDWQVDFAEAERLEQTLKGQDGGSKEVGPTEESAHSQHYNLWRPYPNTP